jgi:16S rRNA (guanine966-N2)-methyltransferase
MRIITGIAGGRTIKVPKDIRPTQEAVRSAIFSILGEAVLKAKCLDLFAGSGAYGLEALSRGAKYCDFVEMLRDNVEIIKENTNLLNFQEISEVIQKEGIKYIGNTENTYDLIFVDPPYEKTEVKYLLDQCGQSLNQDGVIIYEHAKETKIPANIEGIKLLDQRSYGGTSVSFFGKD